MVKFRSPKHPEVDDRMLGPHLPHDQQDQPHHEQDQERLHPPERVAQPVEFLSLAEHDFPAGHDQHQQSQADVIEVQRLAAELGPFLLEVVGVIDHAVRGDQRQEPDRDVDEEDPPPVVVDAEPAAQRRPDDGRDHGSEPEQGHGRALLLGREGVDQDPLAARLEPAAGQPLDHPEQDHLRQAGGEAAHCRREGKDGDRQQEVVAAAEVGRLASR